MSLLATLLPDAVYTLGQEFSFNDHERRMSDYSALQAYIDGSSKLLPKSQIEALETAASQTQKVAVLNRYGATVISTPSCTITPDEITSAFKSLTWVGKGFSIGITESDLKKNYIGRREAFEHQMREGLRAVFESLDTLAVTSLEANKATVNDSTIYPIVGNAMQVANAQKDKFYQNVPAILKRNDLGMKYLDIANTEAIVMEAFLQNQGAGNNQNSQYQFLNQTPYRSNRVVTEDGVAETHYLVKQNALGVYNWNQYEAQMGKKIHDGNGWDQFVDPIMKRKWGVYYDNKCEDGKFVEKMTFFSYFCFINAYSSNGATPILKAEILAEV